jgi:hypothetical protein
MQAARRFFRRMWLYHTSNLGVGSQNRLLYLGIHSVGDGWKPLRSQLPRLSVENHCLHLGSTMLTALRGTKWFM